MVEQVRVVLEQELQVPSCSTTLEITGAMPDRVVHGTWMAKANSAAVLLWCPMQLLTQGNGTVSLHLLNPRDEPETIPKGRKVETMELHPNSQQLRKW